MTYETILDFQQLTISDELDRSILRCLERHVASIEELTWIGDLTMKTAALSDTLKLLFNITHFYPSLIHLFTPTVPLILMMLAKESSRARLPLEPPVVHLINVLLNLNLAGVDPSSLRAANYVNAYQPLIDILDASLMEYTGSDLDSAITPLISLLRRIYALPHAPTKEMMRLRLLPTDQEREKPLGQSQTTFAKLIRLTAEALAPNLRDAVSRFMFELSDSDPATFVRNVGYGYASGFIANNRIETASIFRQSLSMGSEVRRDPDAHGLREINPVTGQFRDSEFIDSQRPMTEEEKLREAERLFVLFERYTIPNILLAWRLIMSFRAKQTGVIEVRNPVEAALQDGRLEELGD